MALQVAFWVFGVLSGRHEENSGAHLPIVRGKLNKVCIADIWRHTSDVHRVVACSEDASIDLVGCSGLQFAVHCLQPSELTCLE